MPKPALQKYVAFLRAINVGGRFVKMNVLADHFRTLGYSDIQTFINSGNVIFSSAASATSLAHALPAGLEPLLGFATAAFVRTEQEVHALAQRAAHLKAGVLPPGEVNIAFLEAPLSAVQVAALDSLRTDIDAFECSGREVFWSCQCGQRDSKFSNAVFERKLKTTTTLRRLSMLERLSEHLRLGA